MPGPITVDTIASCLIVSDTPSLGPSERECLDTPLGAEKLRYIDEGLTYAETSD